MIAHSRLTVFGTFIVWVIAGAIYVWPRVHGTELWSVRMANWSVRLILLRISTMTLGLAPRNSSRASCG